MQGLKLNLNMMRRRLLSSLLTALLIAVTTVFLLLYPGLIQSAEAELAAAYDSIDVTGWIINAAGYEDPTIPPEIYDAILSSGFIREHYDVSYNVIAPVSQVIATLAERDAEFAALPYEEQYLKMKRQSISNLPLYATGSRMYGLNRADADALFSRLVDTIEWLPGYSEELFSGDEAVCIYPADGGVALGDEVELIMRRANPNDEWKDLKREYMTFKVVGLHGMNAGGNRYNVYCPLDSLRKKLSDPKWKFAIRSFSFTVQNSRELDGFKEFLVGLGLHENENIRAVLDDRILTGTVAPIQKNIDLLKNLHVFLYGLVALMGFFLCFLLARGRKQEYAVMRMLGESRLGITAKAILEQVLLCAFGVAIGFAAMLLLPTKQEGWFNAQAAGLVAACYCAGAAVAVLLTVRVDVMTILRDKE